MKINIYLINLCLFIAIACLYIAILTNQFNISYVFSVSSINLETKTIIKNFVNEDLDTVIESVIQLTRGEFQINEKQQALLIKCIIKLCQCFMKNKEKHDKQHKQINKESDQRP